MDSKLCKFSVLRYVPDEYREEFINIGLVMHMPSEADIKIKITENFRRVREFDDEVDLDFLKLVLEGIEEQFTRSIISAPTLYDELEIEDFLFENTRHFVNQLQFSEIGNIYSLNIQKDFDDLFRTYIYFETKRKSRITPEKVKSLMKRVFKDKGIYDRLDKNPSLFTKNNEEISLDYGYDNGKDKKIYMKAFSLDYDKQKNVTSNAKAWVYNLERLKKNQQNDDKEIEFKFILNDSDLNQKNNKIIYDILNEISEPIFLNKLDDFIDKIK